MDEKTPEFHKSQLRAWLYDMLSELELANDVEGTRNQSDGNKVTIEIQFKYKD